LDALQAGLLGLGTVGTGVARILTREAERLRRRTGVPIRLKRVVDLDLERDRGVSLEGLLVSRRAADILEDSEIAVVMELIGGIEPARTFILEALARGKHVVTANKALLASHGPELFKAAAAAGAQIGFEASVCGGIPILGCLREGLAADRVRSLAGIVNGTSNYILSSMTEKRLDFSGCLREAQAEGYAEADPTLDINGKDAAHKLAILVGVAHGVQVDPERIFTEGIEQISGLEIRYAADLGYRIKLLALSKFCDGELEVRVHPTMIPEKHLLAGVNLAFNAVYLTGENTGPLMFYGQGAGMMPTGSAVVGDLISIGRRLQSEARRPAPPLGFYGELPPTVPLKRMDDLVTKYYIRFPVIDRPGVLSSIAGVLGKFDISIHSVIQKGRRMGGPVHIIMLTHEARERDLQEALREIDRLGLILDKSICVRMEDFGDPDASAGHDA